MCSRGKRGSVAVLSLLAAITSVKQGYAHPGCKAGTVALTQGNTIFCPTDQDPLYQYGICCDPVMEANIILQLDGSSQLDAGGECAAMYQEVLCTACHPYSGHLFERLGNGLTMTAQFCEDYYSECSDQLNLPSDYCSTHVGEPDEVWAYPLVIDEDTFDGSLVEAFPGIDLPTKPMDMRMTPDGTKWWIAGQLGEIVEIDVSDSESPPSSTKLVLDITGNANIKTSYEEGLISFAFSPGFHDTGVFFVSYHPPKKAGADQGFNRLSRFEYDPLSAEKTRGSEQIIKDSSEKNFINHGGGWIGFKPSAYQDPNPIVQHELYWAAGDSGDQFDLTQQGQDPTTLHGAISRILISSQMGAVYDIPDGNPFKDSPDQGAEEICAMGFRNPWKCSFDRGAPDGTGADELWCGDVGNDEIESIKKVECGNNYGWRQFEGHRCTAEIDSPDNEFPLKCADDDVRDPYTFPEFSYCHPAYNPSIEEAGVIPDIPNDDFCNDGSVDGTSVTGGFVYRGSKFGDLLYGNYVFADFTVKNLYRLAPSDDGWGTADGNKWSYGVIKDSGFTDVIAFAEANNGELYVIEYQGKIYELPCGDLCSGVGVEVETPPPSPGAVMPTPAPVPLPPAQASIGCYPDGTLDDLKIDSEDMSPQVCNVLCDGLQYFGIQDGSKCFCGDALNCNGANCGDASCDAQCSGDPTQTCGGASTISVFETDPTNLPTLPEAPEPDYVELGCAEDFEEKRVLSEGPFGKKSSDMSAEICLGICATELPGFAYFGTQYSYECWCDTGLPSGLSFEPEFDGCSYSCTGSPGEECGGEFAVTVYQVGNVGPTPEPTPEPLTPVPTPDGDYTELGCAEDSQDNRIFPVGPESEKPMSAEICFGICQDKLPEFAYFGTQYSFECFCATSLPVGLSFKPEHEGCTDTCNGNAGEICGGENAMTVYQVDQVAPAPPSPTPDPEPVPTGDYIELGCASDPNPGPNGARVMSVGPIKDENDMSAKACFDICKSELPEFVYFGTQYSWECFCATSLPVGLTFEPEYEGCTASCAGNPGEICGGTDALTVYEAAQVAPAPPTDPEPVPTGDYKELGCAYDPNPGPDGARVMSVGPIKDENDMSAKTCFDICKDELSEFAYFGTQYSFECFCAKTLPDGLSFDPEYEGCTDTCSGNSGEICGGTDALTVYENLG